MAGQSNKCIGCKSLSVSLVLLAALCWIAGPAQAASLTVDSVEQLVQAQAEFYPPAEPMSGNQSDDNLTLPPADLAAEVYLDDPGTGAFAGAQAYQYISWYSVTPATLAIAVDLMIDTWVDGVGYSEATADSYFRLRFTVDSLFHYSLNCFAGDNGGIQLVDGESNPIAQVWQGGLDQDGVLAPGSYALEMMVGGAMGDMSGASAELELMPAIPEPSTLALTLIGSIGLAGFGLRRRRVN